MVKIEGVIFDWAGTTVDFGSLAPIAAFRGAFALEGINLTDSEIRQEMGIAKYQHIQKILAVPVVQNDWAVTHVNPATEVDVDRIYANFQHLLMENLQDFTTLKPGLLTALDYLAAQQIKVGTTTGYTSEMMAIVAASAAEQGYVPASIVTPEDVGIGRPSPKMMERNFSRLGLTEPSRVMKVGDTVVDMTEAENAGVIGVGVVNGSSLMGYSEETFNALTAAELTVATERVTAAFKDAGAQYVIPDLSSLPKLIATVNGEGN